MKYFSRKKTSFLILILAVACLETSCSFNPQESSPLELLPGWNQQQITITLPPYPSENHPPLAGWKILCWQNSGVFSQNLSPSKTEFTLTMEKNIPTAILCYPLSMVDSTLVSFFHPAGCIYPYSKNPSWEEGFTAEIFFQLAKSKSLQELLNSPLLRFNWSRLTHQIEKRLLQAREKDTIFSPWFLQEEDLKEAIIQGRASTRNIKQHSLTEYRLEEFSQDTSPHTINEKDSKLYYRYIPLGRVEEKIIFPQNTDYTLHPENSFFKDNQILTVFTKKNQKPVLARMAIERYTNQ